MGRGSAAASLRLVEALSKPRCAIKYTHKYTYIEAYVYTLCIFLICKLLGHMGLWDEAVPRLVEALSKRRCILVASGANHTLAVTDNGSLWSWGDNRFGQLGHGTL